MSNGVTIAGNIIVDIIKKIDKYPDKGMLSTITDIQRSVGGCVPNVAVDLARLGGVRVNASGRIGSDTDGLYVLDVLKREGVDCKNVLSTPGLPTAFTDVMTVKGTGERTFFNTRGANAVFCGEDLSESAMSADVMHIGYILLLDALDRIDEEYGTVLARLLVRLRKYGIKTSIDVVSNSTSNFKERVCPALKACNYAVMNEIESGLATGFVPRDGDGKLIKDNIRRILEAFKSFGVEKAFIHCPEAGFCMDASGKMTVVPSLELPDGYIKGAVGAGDAFCAGVLYALQSGFSDSEALELASLTAATNLSSSDSVSGARSYEQTLKLEKEFSRKNI